MQSDTENELRVLTDNLQAKQRHLEHLIMVKEEEVLIHKREVQMRELDIKNFAIIEASLKQEIRQLLAGRIQLED